MAASRRTRNCSCLSSIAAPDTKPGGGGRSDQYALRLAFADWFASLTRPVSCQERLSRNHSAVPCTPHRRPQRMIAASPHTDHISDRTVDYSTFCVNGPTSLTIDQMPPHTHDNNALGNDDGDNAAPPARSNGVPQGQVFHTTSAGGGQSHTHTLSINNAEFGVAYINQIICQKN